LAQNLTAALKNLYNLEKHFGMRSPNNNGLLDVLDELRLAAGICEVAQVNDCETLADWTESSSGNFDATLESTNQKVGSGAITLTATVGNTGTDYTISTDLINGSAKPDADPRDGERTIDWRKYDYIGGWNFGEATGGYGTAAELEIAIQDMTDGSPTWATAIPMNTAPVDNVHKRWEVDISALTRERVQQIRFVNQNENAGEAITIDEIEVYKFGNGWGPVRGPCIWLPIKNGVTIAKGNIVEYEAGTTHRCDLEAAAGVETLGPCVIGGVGNAAGTVLACVQVGGLGYLQANAATVNGEGLIWATGHTVEGVATGEEENAFAKGLEAAGAQYDVIAVVMLKMGSFIA